MRYHFHLCSFVIRALAILIFTSTYCHGADSNKNAKILDMHCHVAGIGAGNSGCYISTELRSNFRYKIYLRAFGVSEEELKQKGDAIIFKHLSQGVAASKYVDGAVILALDGVYDKNGALDYEKTEVYIPNSFVKAGVKPFDNLYHGASINPYRPDALEILDKVAAEGAVLIKWLPSIQHIDPADKKIIPFYKRLRELKLPLLSHAGHEKSFTTAKNHFADPKRLELPLQLGVTVIAAHAATTGTSEGEDNMVRLLSLFSRYENLYTDISSLTQLNKLGYLAKLLKHEGIHKRLLYGTDMPLINTLLVSPWFFPRKLNLSEMFSLSQIDNPWDQDVLIKRKLGVPDEVFYKPYELLIEGKK